MTADNYLHATLGTFFTPRLEMRLFDRVENFTAESATCKNFLTYYHEHIHYFQSIFTGYGHIQWSGIRQATGYVISEWEKLCTEANSFRLPLSNCKDNVQESFRAWMAFKTFEEQSKVSQSRFIVTKKSTKDLGLLTIKSDWEVNPTINFDAKSRILCSKDIIEGHAYYLEKSCAVSVLSIPKDVADNREGIGDTYTAAYDWFVSECGENRQHIFPVVCDLALQISWIPLIPSTEHEWRSANPSWRFYLITKALAADANLSLDMCKPWHEFYLDFCNVLTDMCGFPRLMDILNERLKSLSSLEVGVGLSPVQMIMKNAIEYRIKRPWLTVNPSENADELEFLFEEFRIPAVLVEGRFQSQSDLSESVVVDIIGELHYQAIADHLLGNVSVIAGDSNLMECGFSKYDIPNGCPYQVGGDCIGRFDPQDGLPVPLNVDANGVVQGCTFGVYFHNKGIRLEDVKVDYRARFPKFD